jgi:hypothetical protein
MHLDLPNQGAQSQTDVRLVPFVDEQRFQVRSASADCGKAECAAGSRQRMHELNQGAIRLKRSIARLILAGGPESFNVSGAPGDKPFPKLTDEIVGDCACSRFGQLRLVRCSNKPRGPSSVGRYVAQ